MSFEEKTRLYRATLPTLTKPASGGLTTLALPKSGLLARLYLLITGSIAGTLTAPNALGMASVIRQVRLTANSGLDIFNVSGAGYHYLLRNQHCIYFDPFPGSNARSAVTAAAFDVSMLIECQVNQNDPIGLIMLQNERTQLTLQVQWETDANVATGATVTASCIPIMEYFAVPVDEADWPPITVAHAHIEEQVAVPASGDFTYYWPRGNTYLQMLHGFGIGATPADNWSRVRIRQSQNTFLEDYTPGAASALYALNHPSARILGTIPIDFMGDDGLGAFGRPRDFINSAVLTDLATILTTTGSGTLYAVRRQIVQMV